jgi:DNA replication protein DnaC
VLGDLDDVSDQREVVHRALDWIGEIEPDVVPSWGLAIVGDPGTGKTAVACALAQEASNLGVSVDFITMQDWRHGLTRQMDLMDIIRKFDSVNDDTPEVVEHRARSQRLHAMRNEVGLLVIDDLGGELKSNTGRWIEDQIINLIRHRGDRGLALVVTSNLNRKERVGRYGEPLDSYLHDVCEFFQIGGSDRRRG